MAINQLGDGHADGVQLPDTKLGFFGSDPVAQPATIADATNTTTTTSTTTALTTDLDSLRTKFNSLLAKLETLGLLADA
jgi:hypothetical protein